MGPAWSTQWIPGQPGIFRETLPQKLKQNKKTNQRIHKCLDCLHIFYCFYTNKTSNMNPFFGGLWVCLIDLWPKALKNIYFKTDISLIIELGILKISFRFPYMEESMPSGIWRGGTVLKSVCCSSKAPLLGTKPLFWAADNLLSRSTRCL